MKYLLSHLLFLLVANATSVECWTQITMRVTKNVPLIKKNAFALSFDIISPKFYDGKLYCININKQQIVALNSNGSIHKEFGGKGQGPGEFQNIIDFSVNQYGVSVIDGITQTITVFNYQAKIKSIYRYPNSILAGVQLDDPYLYLIKSGDINLDNGNDQKEVFHIVNIDKNTLKTFSINFISPIPPQLAQIGLHNIVINGQMVSNGAGKIFRASQRSGEFIAFDAKTGRVLFGRKTVDQSVFYKDKIPQSSNINDNEKTVSISLSNSRIINFATAANSKYILILSNAASPSVKDKSFNITDERIVDVYQVKNGDYVYSFEMPKHNGKRATHFTIYQNKIYAVYGDEIVEYDCQLP